MLVKFSFHNLRSYQRQNSSASTKSKMGECFDENQKLLNIAQVLHICLSNVLTCLRSVPCDYDYRNRLQSAFIVDRHLTLLDRWYIGGKDFEVYESLGVRFVDIGGLFQSSKMHWRNQQVVSHARVTKYGTSKLPWRGLLWKCPAAYKNFRFVCDCNSASNIIK